MRVPVCVFAHKRTMLLVAYLLLASSIVTAEIRSAGWRPIAPQGEPGGHLAISYHTLHSGGGPSLPVQRYHQLEHNLPGKASLGHDHCALYKVSFVQDLYFQYIHYKTSLPDLKEFTVCLWHKFYNHSNDHPLFSYAVPDQPRAIYLWVSNTPRSSYFSLSVESHTFFRLNYPLRLNRWYHSCTSWNGRTGEWQIWVNAERVGRGFHNRLVGHVIPGGGIAITGQEQQQYGGGFLEGKGSPKGSGGFLGEVTQLYMYKAALAAGKAHRDHKHHHGNHEDITTPDPLPVSTGPPLPSHPLLIAGQLIPRLNINAQLGSRLTLQNPPPPHPENPLLASSLLQQAAGSTSSITLPGASPFSIQHAPALTGSLLGGSSLLGPQNDSGSILNIQHSLFKRDEGHDTSAAAQNSTATRTKRSLSSNKKKFHAKKYLQGMESPKFKSTLRELNGSLAIKAEDKPTEHKIIKRAIRFSDGEDNGHYLGSRGSSLIGSTAIGLLGGDFNPISGPQQQEDDPSGTSSTDDNYPREPAEGEVRQVMNICSGCDPEPFKKAEIISWRNTPKKLYAGALYTLANPECKRF